MWQIKSGSKWVRSQWGVWVNLDLVECINVVQDKTFYIRACGQKEERYTQTYLAEFDTREKAQESLDQLMSNL